MRAENFEKLKTNGHSLLFVEQLAPTSVQVQFNLL